MYKEYWEYEKTFVGKHLLKQPGHSMNGLVKTQQNNPKSVQ